MFTMHKIYNGEDVPMPTLYVDEVGKWYQWENVKIHCLQSPAHARSVMVFDGTDDRVNVGSALSTVTTELSLCFWVKTTDTLGRLFARRDGGGVHFDVYTQSGNFSFYEGTVIRSADTGNLNNDTWQHRGLVVESGNLQFFYNGEPDSTPASVSVTPYTTDTLIGAFGGGGGLSGLLRDVQVFTRALSASEILQLYQGEQVANGRAGYWLGTGNTDADWQDLSGNANHGTVNGSPSMIASLEQESLDLANVQADGIFQINGVSFAFPLQGSAFLTPQTGTLKLRVSQSLDSGIYLYPFVTEIPRLNMAGQGLAGMGRYASKSVLSHALSTYVQVQVIGNAAPYAYTVPMVTN